MTRPPTTVVELLKVVLPIAADLAEDAAHAGRDRDALDKAMMRLNARLWDEFNRRILGTEE